VLKEVEMTPALLLRVVHLGRNAADRARKARTRFEINVVLRQIVWVAGSYMGASLKVSFPAMR